MLAKLKKRNQGFTIIEVMIVLAIAGLILLIVFLAVPALQRSSRNTQRKQDVGRITSAATTVLSDNNNTIADLTNAALQAELGTLSFYANTSVTVTSAAAGGYNGTPKNAVGDTAVLVVTGATCGQITTGAGGQGAETSTDPTSLAVLYATETGSGVAEECNSD